ncbi:ABC transporter ATP-binding protein [Coleofasciculus chthonoplastes]|uniref:ABC transporter ATP-binding protein n=1 Tax=Coleofasciculus chthonoplastes TaxID=64178 RepID=UPI0032F2BF90
MTYDSEDGKFLMNRTISESTEKDIANQSGDNEVVISVDGISKKFCRDLKRSLFYGVQDITTDLVGGRRQSEVLRPSEFWALKDVSFQLRRGEALGLVGANGAGKSTLLRIISGLIKPDTGLIKVKGRVAPLIALGAGFNPILTGRENIYANMAILGLSKKEIEERFDAVVDFAEIGDAIDAPVQTYSSGMAARLGFASAIHVDPDILLLDEVLAVGDIKFRAKCGRRLAEIREKGTSFILVNHKPAAILSICDSAVYLSQGKVVLKGETNLIIKQYEEDLMIKGIEYSKGKVILPEKDEAESGGIDITYLCFRGEGNDIINFPQTGKPAYFCVGCKVHRQFDDVYLKCKVCDMARENEIILDLNSDYDNNLFSLETGNTEIQIKMSSCNLKPSTYSMEIYLVKKPQYCFDIIQNFRFKVEESEDVNLLMSRNLYYQDKEWVVKNI